MRAGEAARGGSRRPGCMEECMLISESDPFRKEKLQVRLRTVCRSEPKARIPASHQPGLCIAQGPAPGPWSCHVPASMWGFWTYPGVKRTEVPVGVRNMCWAPFHRSSVQPQRCMGLRKLWPGQVGRGRGLLGDVHHASLNSNLPTPASLHCHRRTLLCLCDLEMAQVSVPMRPV